MSFVSYAQNFEDVMLWRALGHVSGGFYIDVGAWSPVEDSVTLAFYERGWHGINIEPNPEFHRRLQEERPRDVNLAVAVADHPGRATMHFMDSPGLSTLVDEVAAAHAEAGMCGHSESVEVTTLAEVWRRHVPAGQPVHFLKVDVEGAESAVLRGNDWGACRPWLLVIEATVPMSQDRSHESWEPSLLTQGYLQAYDDGINRFYVAAEHAGLLKALAHPPNYFDHFVPAAQVTAERLAVAADARAGQSDERAWRAEIQVAQSDERAWRAGILAAEAQERAWRAEQRIGEAEARAADAVRHADEIEHRMSAVFASYSWRITAPLRAVAGELLQLRAHVLRALRPRLPGPSGDKGPARFPELAAGKRVAEAAEGTPRPDVEHAPRVIRLRDQLRRLAVEGRAPAAPAAPLRLAYVSPLPPECTGIADYSAELLPALSAHFRIDVVVQQSRVDAPDVLAGCAVRSGAWLRSHAGDYDAVLYHIGNSHFHTWMFELLQEVPGLVVLHDFFLGGLIQSLPDSPGQADRKPGELYWSHGYAALAQCMRSHDPGDSFFRHPCNRTVLEHAHGVIVHSNEAVRLARRWYGSLAGAGWARIPHVRVPAAKVDRQAARRRLGLPESAFVVCSFGLLGGTKLNHRLLRAWLGSDLARESDGLLVFVGDAGKGDFSRALHARIRASGVADRIRITGWADALTFRDYLASADLAVQLRSHSRGETSGTVLDCMNHGLPTIVNAHGSMAELPEGAVFLLPDEFDDAQLVDAMERLRRNASERMALGERARAAIARECAPEHCAELYRKAIEESVAFRQRTTAELWEALQRLGEMPPGEAALLTLASDVALGTPDPLHQVQLLVDITETIRSGRQTGIERVARALAVALLEGPPTGCRVEPVYLSQAGGRWHYRYARAYSAGLLGIASPAEDRGIDYGAGDCLICLDISGDAFVQASGEGLFERMRARGVHCRAFVHDILPVREPECFPPGADRHFRRWLDSVARLDGAVCFLQTVADGLRDWMKASHGSGGLAFQIDCIPAGADIAASAPSRGLPHDAEALLARIGAEPSVLMVGTLEPRKRYMQALLAFTQLWRQGMRLNLVIVGRPGWQDLPIEQQRDIPELLDALRTHPELGRRLIWLDGVSDEYLERVYSAAAGLLAASQGEGFGLPLIEAARSGLPLLIRDIPVFREVAGEHASYFTADTPAELAMALADWAGRGFGPPPGRGENWTTWQDSAARLAEVLLGNYKNAPGVKGGDAVRSD